MTAAYTDMDSFCGRKNSHLNHNLWVRKIDTTEMCAWCIPWVTFDILKTKNMYVDLSGNILKRTKHLE